MQFLNLHSGLSVSAKNKPHETAITFENEKLTYLELYNRVKSIGHSLMAKGIGKGDHVVLYMRNRLETAEIYFAVSMIGAVSVPINYMVKGNDLTALINKSDAKLAFIETDSLQDYNTVLDSLDSLDASKTVLLSDEEVATEFVSYQFFNVGKFDEINIEVGQDDLACLMYSSGTTALPKGIMLTQGAMLMRVLKIPFEWSVNYKSVFLITVPLYHSIGCNILYILSVLGIRIAVTREFGPEKTLQVIQDEKVTHSVFVPTQYILMLQQPNLKQYDLSSLVRLISGGAPITEPTKASIIKEFNCKFSEFFGSSETGAYISLRPDSVLSKSTSIGQQAEDAQVRLLDENGNDVGVNEGGEFAIKSSTLFKGYYNQPEETEKSFIEGGWFLTGDMGRVDEDGYYYLLDRKKDMIISGGVNIYSKDIEEILFKHQAVLEAAVIGIQDEVWGESVKAYVVLKGETEITEEELMDYCNNQLSKYQRIKELEFVAEFPRNPSGKILKRQLRPVN
ncbi:class I adenylate-forming enzyme family protein [Oceanobacillus longus]|uniref:Class I adenylate-forming enzyme family protein n=1 Tax=Oceanobacillus longus TaxID=930120 RepID=A0ABV8GWJ4_9BACI